MLLSLEESKHPAVNSYSARSNENSSQNQHNRLFQKSLYRRCYTRVKTFI